MSDLLNQLRRDPQGALKQIKPTNPVLKDIFVAIPANERPGVAMPERGYDLKQWLIQWAEKQLDNPSSESAPAAAAATFDSASLSSTLSSSSSSSELTARQPSSLSSSSSTTAHTLLPPPSPSSALSSSIPSSPTAHPPHHGDASDHDAHHSLLVPELGMSRCQQCKKKDMQIKKLTMLVQNLLGQLDDLALEVRGDLTLITS